MAQSVASVHRPMPNGGPVTWEHACWVGEIDTEAIPAEGMVVLDGWEGERSARLLVREAERVRGFVSLAVNDGRVDADALRAEIASLGDGDAVLTASRLPLVSVVLCTKDRPDMLAVALGSVLAVDYPHLDVVVVDNAPSDDGTERFLSGLDDPRVRRVLEPVAGLAGARNTGIRAATGEIVAFTDDDVIVDRSWVRRLVAAFELTPDVGCVSGLVPSGELRTPAQAYFDQRVTWSDAVTRRVFSLNQPPAGMPLFPFQVGEYGTGANFAVRRDVLLRLGGFDEALGVGTPSGGGEDLDMFVRVILGGWTLVVEPAAVTWHRHRADEASLTRQVGGYGRGLGAWLSKVVSSPATAPLAARRGIVGLRRFAAVRSGSVSARHAGSGSLPAELVARLGRLEARAVLQGPGAYWQGRRSGKKARPLA